MMRNEPKRYQFTPDYRLVAAISGSAFEDILGTARMLLLRLLPPAG
jgi:transcription-repair coupling factor (superfamily II helicase)